MPSAASRTAATAIAVLTLMPPSDLMAPSDGAWPKPGDHSCGSVSMSRSVTGRLPITRYELGPEPRSGGGSLRAQLVALVEEAPPGVRRRAGRVDHGGHVRVAPRKSLQRAGGVLGVEAGVHVPKGQRMAIEDVMAAQPLGLSCRILGLLLLVREHCGVPC